MVDQLLGGLFGSQDDDDDERRRARARDFVSRYDQGPPYEGISSDEAYHNYRTAAERLSPEEYEEAAAEAYQRMSPRERAEFAQMMRERGGAPFGSVRDDDPRDLARATARFRQQEPGGLAALFGGGGGGGLGDMLGASMGGQRGGGGGMGDLLGNPLAKAALGGIAAMAMKRMMDR